MNTPSQNNVNIPSLKNLVTGPFGLKYCCLFFFFSIFRRTSQIALRLGVSSRLVRYYKADFNRGIYQCENCPNCMKSKIKAIEVGGIPTKD